MANVGEQRPHTGDKTFHRVHVLESSAQANRRGGGKRGAVGMVGEGGDLLEGKIIAYRFRASKVQPEGDAKPMEEKETQSRTKAAH